MKKGLPRMDVGGSSPLTEDPGAVEPTGFEDPSVSSTMVDEAVLERESAGNSRETPTRIRLWFSKSGDLRLISHLDLLRAIERLVRRAGIPVASSLGYSPRPKIVFGLALALGVEGRRELVELELTKALSPQSVLDRLQAAAPEGLRFLEALESSSGRPPRIASVRYEFPVPIPRVARVRESISDFLRRDSIPFTRIREGRSRLIDLRPFLLDACVGDDGKLEFQLEIDPAGSARPEEILDALGLKDLFQEGSVLSRTRLELAE
jgi:radical SAM-linked protein